MKKFICLTSVALVVCLTIWLLCPSKGDEDLPVPPPVPSPEKLTVKHFPRDEKTGESLRSETRDEFGSLRQLEIHYSDKTTGMRFYNALGRLTKISRSTTNGAIMEASLSAGSNSITEWSRRDSQGALLLRAKFIAPDKWQYQSFRADGTLQWQNTLEADDKQIFKTFHSDGKTVHIETSIGAIRQWLKIYRPDGRLLYHEQVADPNAKFGSAITYNGTVHSDSGTALQRLSSVEGPHSNWHGTVRTVDELADDGTVKRSGPPATVNNSGFRKKLADPVLQGIVVSKTECYKLMVEGHLRSQSWQSDLEEVLKN